MPGLGVSVAVFEGDSVLLTRRADLPVWCLPSGGVDGGETVAEAARRETREETGLEVRLLTLVGIYSRPHWWDGGTHGVLFRAEPSGGELLSSTSETVDAGYFDVTDLPDDLLWWHAQRIADAHLGRSGLVMAQEMRPLAPGGRQALVRAIESGRLPVEKFLAEATGSPRTELQRIEVGPR